MERIEIVPGLTIEIDESKWAFVDGYGVLPRGRDHKITVDLRITSEDSGETNKAEAVVIVRTA